MDTYDIIVVGGGAAGILAAGSAAAVGAQVLLLEKMERPGRKLLITGKGRCNITNNAPMDEFIKQIQPRGRFLKHAFNAFFSHDIIGLLAEHGLACVLERGGRYFPATDQSKDVLNALMLWLEKNHVTVKTNIRAEKLLVEHGAVKGLVVSSAKTKWPLYAGAVVLATGGLSYPATGSTGDGFRLAQSVGHIVVQARPALVPLETSQQAAMQMQGLSLKNVKASVWVHEKKMDDAFGEMLFTHFGLSGPIVLSLSRLVVDSLNAGQQVDMVIDLKPALEEKQLDNRLLRDLNEHGKRKIPNLLRLWLPAAMVPVIIELAGIDAEKVGHQLLANERKKLVLLMKNLRFPISGYRPFKEAIITAGGIDTNEILSRTMESKRVKNLFFAGEMIDLDANTGGYNLQIAWSTGWLAGKSAAQQSQPQPQPQP